LNATVVPSERPDAESTRGAVEDEADRVKLNVAETVTPCLTTIGEGVTDMVTGSNSGLSGPSTSPVAPALPQLAAKARGDRSRIRRTRPPRRFAAGIT
jgi:hypothetical protein